MSSSHDSGGSGLGFCNYLSGLGSTLSSIGQQVSAQIDGTLQTVALNIEQTIRDNVITGVAPAAAAAAADPRRSHQPFLSSSSFYRGSSAAPGGSSASSPGSEEEANFMGSGGLSGQTKTPDTTMLNCDNCGSKFSFRNRKKQCKECQNVFCSNCCPKISRFKDRTCTRCKILMCQPPVRADLMELRVKDLQRYLISKQVNTKACVEKKDLVELIMRQNGGETRSSSFSANPNTAGVGGGGNLAPIERQKSFPKNYVESTHRHDWLQRFQEGDEEGGGGGGREQQQSPDNDEDLVRDFVVVPEDGGSSASSGQRTPEAAAAAAVETPVEPMLSPRHSKSPSPVAAAAAAGEEPSANGCDRAAPAAAAAAAGNESRRDGLLNPNVEELGGASSSTSTPSSPRKFAQQGLVYLTEVETLEELSELSVKQMKEVLAVNRVNFKGVMEKEELLKIVERLWKAERKMMDEKDKLGDSELCKICMDNPVDCVMLECGHMCTCITCGKQMSECPMCRQYVIRVVKIFKS